jgi:hypothetical protein
MSTNTTTRGVCRLLGGSGRARLAAVPVRRLPALLAPTRPFLVVAHAIPFSLPLAA